MINVEIRRYRNGNTDEDESEFNTMEEAREYGAAMALHYGYRVWIDGSEYSRKDFTNG